MITDLATQQKWDKIYNEKEQQQVNAVRVVVENLHLLPKKGKGLELACGLAANSFLLASNGIDMEAWDISPVAAKKINQHAAQCNANVNAIARDVIANPPAKNAYDVIVISRFLDRSIAAAILQALKPGGLLFYQTFTQTCVVHNGPKKNEWRLADGELLALFSELRPLVYREEGLVGDTDKGLRNEAMLVAQKN